MVDWIKSHISSKWMFLLMLNLILIVVGMIMDIFSAIVVVVPLLIPAATAFHIDPYHLGIIFLLNLELGYMTPPVGLNLFISSFRFQKSIIEVIRATLPLLGCTAVALVLVTYVPALVVLPPKARKGNMRQLYIMVERGAKKVRTELASQGWAKEIDLGKGKKITAEECTSKTDVADKMLCTTLFQSVTKCRKAEPVDPECEKKAVKSYNEVNGDGGGGGEDFGVPDEGGGGGEDFGVPDEGGGGGGDDEDFGVPEEGGDTKDKAAKPDGDKKADTAKPDAEKKAGASDDEDFGAVDDGSE
jgi:hypothetical protein